MTHSDTDDIITELVKDHDELRAMFARLRPVTGPTDALLDAPGSVVGPDPESAVAPTVFAGTMFGSTNAVSFSTLKRNATSRRFVISACPERAFTTEISLFCHAWHCRGTILPETPPSDFRSWQL